MDLLQTLTELANFYHMDTRRLIEYAVEDTIGGFHLDERFRTYHTGAIWGVEGQVLYALIRHIKPSRVIDLGTGVGCSVHHIAAALKANDSGMVYTVDNNMGAEAGHLDKSRLAGLTGHIHFVNGEAVDWLRGQTDQSFDLMFEDWSHDPAIVSEVWQLAARKLVSGGFMMTHDSEHWLVGAQVWQGILDSHVPPFGMARFMPEPSDCGFTIWQKDYGNIQREVPVAYDLIPAPELVELESAFNIGSIIDYEAGLTDEDIEHIETLISETVADDDDGTINIEARIDEIANKLEAMTKPDIIEWVKKNQGLDLNMSMSKPNMIIAAMDREAAMLENQEAE